MVESTFLEVLELVLGEYGKSSNPEIELMAAGVRPLDAWETIAQALEINEKPQVLYDKASSHLDSRWEEEQIAIGMHEFSRTLGSKDVKRLSA